jgi:hypothetical protein
MAKTKGGKGAGVTVTVPKALAKSLKVVQGGGRGITIRVSKQVKRPSIGVIVK